MKNLPSSRVLCGLVFGFLAMAGQVFPASFTPGNLAVFRADSSSSNNTTATVVEISATTANQTNGAVQAIAIDGTTLPGALRFSGSASSTGYLSLSADGSLLVFTGHNDTNTGVNANTLTARGVGTLGASGTFALATTYTGTTGNQTRGATSLNNSTWFIGDQGGVYSNGTTSANPSGNLRAMRTFGGTVYTLSTTATSVVSSVSAATSGSLGGLPGLPAGATSNQDFYLVSSGSNGSTFDVLYLLSSTSASAGTISKYSLVSGTWTANGSYTTSFGGFGLAAARNGSGADLFVSTGTGANAANSVVKVTDTTGYNQTIAVTTGNNVTLYTAPAGTTVKGVAFAPQAPLSAPSFAVHPSSQSVTYNTTAALTASAGGNPLPSYQWYQGSSGDTSTPVGTNSSSFTTPALTATTNYWVRATNSQGTADSNTATITVTQAPAITTPPVNQTIVSGGTASLSVVATGLPAPTYQWYQGASGVTTSPVSGATNASFTTPALSATTSFWVRATNPSGSADSSAATVTVVPASPISGSNRSILIPNTGSWSTGGVTVNGTTFINLGLQGVGRIPASAKDAATGESLGSISDMQITAWKKNADGSYSGKFHFLPDRGYNSGAIFSNYAARINTFDFSFTPYTSPTSTTDQNQIALTFTGSTRFTYNNGSANIFTTGTLADGSVTLFGTLNPVTTAAQTQSDGTYANRLTVDAEGLVLDRRAGKGGQGWIGDEYGASIYHFNASKQIDGQVILPAVYVPHSPVGTTNFAGTPTNGRRDNQGMEGLAQSPDGTRLFGLMQSALVQDSLTGNQGRFNTRLLVYDVNATDTPNDPIAQYVIQLPVADDTGSTSNGTTVNRNCAQSSIVALNNHQLLILSRDGNGRGASGSPVFKSILLADLNGATNIDGTYDAEGNTILSSGALNPAITPVTWSEALNMIGKLGAASAAEVAKFGLNLNTAPGDINTICEKWEALSLVSANDPANPNDYFLFVGNDNDFLTRSGKYLDASGTLQNYDAGLENDTLVLAWRVRMTGSDNQAPFVAANIPDQAATELAAFNFTFDAGTFADPEGTTLGYTATMADDSPLPAWLNFNAATRTFSGTPALADVGALNVKVTATDGGSPALSVSAPFTITVAAAPASFSFASASTSVVESAGNATLTINRAGGQGATSVNVSTTDGTALAGTDYTAQTNVVVNFIANQASATVNVPVTNRSGLNGNRGFTASLSGGTTTSPATTTVTITDSESSFAFSASTATVSEAGGSVILTINRTGRTDVANSVSVTTANGTAVAGTDYTAQSGVAVNFAINDTSKTISIPVINRPGIRASRTFSAALSVSGAPLLTGTPASATVTITEADSYGAMTGPSSSRTPYIQPLNGNWQVTSLLTVGDQVPVTAGAGGTPLVGGKYEMAGIPDGLGAYDNGDGTFTLLMNHELGNGVGVNRAHGAKGAFVSEWVISKSTLQVISGSDLMRNVYGWNTGLQASDSTTSVLAFNRFCSADLPAATAFYNAASGLGTQERVYLNGEEGGATGVALAHVATGSGKGSTYVLGKFNLTTNGSGLTGVGAWENLLANPYAQDKTVVVGNNDGGTGIMNNSVAVYVGTKQSTGTEADKAGLTNGTLKFVNVTGNSAEIVNTATRATNITSGTRFTLSATASTTFSRPEDGAWDPTNLRRFYFVTTDQLDQVADGAGSQVGRTRLWRLTFDDITNPDAGGVIDLLIEGGGTLPVANDANMFDNITVTADGKVVLCEDVGNADHNGKVWYYDPATNVLSKVLKHDIARFGDVTGGVVTAATSPFNKDEETSGVIDVTALLGGNAATGERSYLIVDQAHYTTGITTAQVEGGQLLLVKQAATFLGVAAGDADSSSATLWAGYNKTTPGATVNVQVSAFPTFAAATTVASGVPSTANGWTSKVRVTGLTPATTYYYRFVELATGEVSNTGKFKTAPASNASYALHFAFSGDNDGIMRPYPLASTLAAQSLDFYVNLGDTIYENASVSLGNNGASWLNSPSVTLSGSSASLNGEPTATGFATAAQLKADYEKKYRENFLPVNVGGQNSLKDFYASQGNYTTWDNHELGNRQYINGGAPAGGSVGGPSGTDMATGRGVDARNNGSGNPGNINDVNTSASDYMNRSTGFTTLRDVFLNWMPIADRAPISAPSDPRTDGSKQLYNSQQWGKNAVHILTDTRSYRDLRLKTANGGADDTTAPRANHVNRTMFGATQLAWLKQQLLAAQAAGVPWKFVSVSDPIDQLGPIGGALSGTLTSVNSDGGKSFIGGYRAERNALLKWIADNHILNVVFLATDDHQNRINEMTYSPTDTENQATYVKVPCCFSIVCGPLGATGPETITNHSFSNIKAIADSVFNAQNTAGIEPIGLVGYPGLKNLTREGDPNANSSPQAVDFYSPDTFNYTVLDVSADGKTLTVTSKGINAFAQNAALEYDPVNNPVRTVFSFQVDASQTAVETWRQTYFGSSSNDGAAANAADSDGDGLTNLQEFAFGTNPSSPSSGALQYNGTLAGGGTLGATGQPITLVEPITDGIDFRAIFVRRKDFATAGLTYTPQFSADLVNWQSSADTPAVLADDGTYQVVSVPYPAFVGGKKARFFRVSVSIAP